MNDLNIPPGIHPSEIYPISPTELHTWLFFAMLVLAICIRVANGRTPRLPQLPIAARFMTLWIPVINACCYSLVLVQAYISRDVIGYIPAEHWAWLKTIYGVVPVYRGEWITILVILLVPVVATLLVAMFARGAEARAWVWQRLLRKYATIIAWTYIWFGLAYISYVEKALDYKPLIHNQSPRQPMTNY